MNSKSYKKAVNAEKESKKGVEVETGANTGSKNGISSNKMLNRKCPLALKGPLKAS